VRTDRQTDMKKLIVFFEILLTNLKQVKLMLRLLLSIFCVSVSDLNPQRFKYAELIPADVLQEHGNLFITKNSLEDCGSTVVKPECRWFDPSWCYWNFLLI